MNDDFPVRDYEHTFVEFSDTRNGVREAIMRHRNGKVVIDVEPDGAEPIRGLPTGYDITPSKHQPVTTVYEFVQTLNDEDEVPFWECHLVANGEDGNAHERRIPRTRVSKPLYVETLDARDP